ncbi:MAG: tetratricopeptide repeat protein [Nitrosomonadales bacterium]|nr:tetratricopeptide repeat protein [Nitrosomonadales bacterium]
MKKIGRNDPCPCGSGKKYKQCCLKQQNVPAASAHESAPASQSLRLAAEHFRAGRLPQAEEVCRQALRIEPDNPEARHMLEAISGQLDGWHVNQGLSFHAQGRLEEAVASYRKALVLKPDSPVTHYNIGIVFNEQGKPEEAIASCRQAIALNPDFAEAHSNLGNALQAQGRLDEAIAGHRNALALRPDCVEWLYNLGTALQEQGELNEAIACYRRALELRPTLADAWYNLHALLLDSTGIAPAIECMRKAVEIAPSNTNYRLFLGMLLDYSGKAEEASGHLDMAGKGTALIRAKLDAWRYMKSASKTLPPVAGNPVQVFKLGMSAARGDGLVLEFGVRFGCSIRRIAALADRQAVHGFDSFEGLPEAWYNEPKGSYSTRGMLPAVPGNVVLHAGWFDDTLPAFLNENAGPVRFMNVDCDLYSSTKTVLELLADRIVAGTVIVFDEYIGNERWREDEFRAFQEAAGKFGWNYEYLCFSLFTKQAAVRII